MIWAVSIFLGSNMIVRPAVDLDRVNFPIKSLTLKSALVVGTVSSTAVDLEMPFDRNGALLGYVGRCGEENRSSMSGMPYSSRAVVCFRTTPVFLPCISAYP